MKKGLTYKDVLLVPKKTPLMSRNEADIKSRFTRNISLNIPLVSSNMATVTEHKMAIAMAHHGGIGVIHQFNTVEEQVEEIRKVKQRTSYVIDNPLSVPEHISIKEAINIMETRSVTSLLVVRGEELIGIFTSRDYLFEKDLTIPISQVMTPREKIITTHYGTSLEEAKAILHKHRIEKLPLLQDGRLKGLITTKDIAKLEIWPNAVKDPKGRLRVAAAVGVKDTIERSKALIEAGVDVIVLDLAHCHSDFAIQRIKEFKVCFPDIDIMAGNIATAEAALDLIKAGADGLKVGIGPSSVCTTRIMAGSGVPQFTAIQDVCRVANEFDIPVTADGGMELPGDVAKAIAAGASTIFSGFFFAGTTEAPGIVMWKDGRRYKRYMGSASYESNHERKEHLAKKRIKERIPTFIEGVSKLVPYKGHVAETIDSLTRGLKSGISYCGARNIKEMQQKAEFLEITSSGWQESKNR